MISIVIPAYNEEDSILPLYHTIENVPYLKKVEHEIIFVDDGSSDDTAKKILSISDNRVVLLQLRRNFGQTAAFVAGFQNAKGDIIVTMDADLQNDPNDIPKLIKELERYDVVCGWRKNRKDPLGKKIASLIARFIRKAIANDTTKDPGCSLKAFKKHTVQNLKLFGETHRFIPFILKRDGYKVGEIEVHHHPRTHGKTKYNSKRFINGIMDLILIQFWGNYQTKPLHLLGRIGIGCFTLAFLFLAYNIIRYGIMSSLGPTLLLAILLFFMGIQFIIFGIIIDVLMRLYAERSEDSYEIKEIVRR